MSNRKDLPVEVTHYVRDHCCAACAEGGPGAGAEIDEALRPLGLNQGQFSLLMSLNRPDAPTIGKVSTFLAMDRTTLTANLKPLERRDLLKSDGRQGRQAQPAPAADRRWRRLLIEAVPIWKKTHAGVDKLFSKTVRQPAWHAGLAVLSAHDAQQPLALVPEPSVPAH